MTKKMIKSTTLELIQHVKKQAGGKCPMHDIVHFHGADWIIIIA